MILPLIPFLLFSEPERPITDAPTVTFTILEEDGSDAVGPFELCHDSVTRSGLDFSDFEGHPVVNVTLSEPMSQRFAEVTARYVFRQAAIRIAGETISTPRINEPLSKDSFAISGLDSVAQAEQVLQSLNGRCRGHGIHAAG